MDKKDEGSPNDRESQDSKSSGRQRTESEGADVPEKRVCTEGEITERSSAMQVPSSPVAAAAAGGVPPSPPQFVSLEDVMKAADGLKNMALAHEIAVDSEFSLPETRSAPPEGSLQARVQEMMHKAFWDLLETELQEEPPRYSQAMNLLREVKEMLLELVPPKAVSLRTDIEHRLDVELVQQQAEAGTLNFQDYAGYVIATMAKMCCPARDDDVNALKSLTDVVSTFKGILEVLKKMKVDYANFAIREARPFIIANSIKYEKKKFNEFLATQTDGLAETRAWLLKVKERVTAEAGAETNPKLLQTKILSCAFVEALDWPKDQLLPETLSMDRVRLQRLGSQVQQLTILASVVFVTMPVVGQSVRDLAAFKKHLKKHVKLLLQEDGAEGLAEQLPAVAAQVRKEVTEVMSKLGIPALSEETFTLLTGQLEALAQPTNPIRQLASSRLRKFLEEVASSSKERQLLLPTGFSALAEEMRELAGQFGSLVWYNQAVFGEHYGAILALVAPPTPPAAASSTA